MPQPRRRLLSLAALVLAGLVAGGCSLSDCTDPAADHRPRSFVPPAGAAPGDQGWWRDVSVGTGRLAQEDRRMVLDLELESFAGERIGSGRRTIEEPEIDRSGSEVAFGRVPESTLLYPKVVWMRVGGVREFTLQVARVAEACGRRSDGTCELRLDDGVLRYPADTPVRVRATLVSVCAPVYCVQTTYSIPAMRNRRVVERSCR